jgi:hypothetical protein
MTYLTLCFFIVSTRPSHREVTPVLLVFYDLLGQGLLHCVPNRPPPHYPYRRITPAPVNCVMTCLAFCFFSVYLPGPAYILRGH